MSGASHVLTVKFVRTSGQKSVQEFDVYPSILLIVLAGLAATKCGGSDSLSARQAVRLAVEPDAQEIELSNQGPIALTSEIRLLTNLRIVRLDDSGLEHLELVTFSI